MHDLEIMNSLNLSILHLLMFVLPVCFSSSNTDWYDSCGQNFTCGNFSAGFPFWGGSSRPKECGYPELELTCEDEIKPTIEIAKMKFYVMKMFTNTKVLRIVREDLYDGICIQKFVNTTLNFKEFDYAPGTQNITILYGCPSQDESGGYGGGSTSLPGQFICRINGVNDTTSYYESGVKGPYGCYASVVVPVLASLEAQIDGQGIGNNTISLSQAVDGGFDVKHTEQDEDAALCVQCVASKGRCGFDLSKSNATCVCPDGSFGHTPCSIKPQISRHPGKNRKHKSIVIAASVISGTSGVSLLAVILWLWLARRKKKRARLIRIMETIKYDGNTSQEKHFDELPFFEFGILADATKNFNISYKLGQGGFGLVYKGILKNGQEIAVKRLSVASGQGLEEFRNEVIVISRLQHMNLVKLIGFCVEGDEKLLVYEYMPNKSLSAFLFDPVKRELLDWSKRRHIIEGICRGLVYLHRDSRLRIIHRDLKAGNVLLDEKLNPKISDFGMARIFKHGQDQDETRRVIGTYGYMAPEYAMEGHFSEKSDVYSFGVLLLEIVSGKRNNFLWSEEESLTLLGYTWKLWVEGEEGSIIDPIISDLKNKEIERAIQIGLLCVQESVRDRPSTSTILLMLSSDIANLPRPQQPGFNRRQVFVEGDGSSQHQSSSGDNYGSITTFTGR